MPSKKLQKTDALTVCLHWSLFLTLLISLATGLRIAGDSHGSAWARALDPILLQGAVVNWHIWSALALTFIMVAYIVFLYRARLRRRIMFDAGARRNLVQGTTERKLRSLNILIYWISFLLLILSVLTGLVLYVAPNLFPFLTVLQIHNILAWAVIFYVALHVVAQLAHGGIRQLLRMMSPRAAFGAAAFSATMVAGGAVAGLFVMDQLAMTKLSVQSVATAPQIDGRGNDPVWSEADSVEIPTARGVNSPDGEVVTVRMVRDDDTFYALFQWPDSTRSAKHLPLIKTEEGWRVVQHDYGIQDEDTYYEDKFGVMFANTPELAGAKTAHMGSKPLEDKPGPAGGRGLHYTTDGSLVDVWHWKSVRTGSFDQIDDNHFGPPMEAKEGGGRYTGGYDKDPKDGGGYVMNWEKFSEETIVPIRLPKSPEMLAPFADNALNPSESDAIPFAMHHDDTVEYSKAADTYPVGTIMPSVLIKGPHRGDRGEVIAKAHWEDGMWTLETQRKLNTGSEFDFVMEENVPVYMWVAVFNHTQTRHSQHLHPVQLDMN